MISAMAPLKSIGSTSVAPRLFIARRVRETSIEPGNTMTPVWRSGSPTEAPSGGTFLTGAQWKSWNGALVVACLKTDASIGQRLLVSRCQHLRRGVSLGRIHAHVEDVVAPEAEPPVGRVELQRRHAKIRQHPIDPADAARVEHVGQFTIVAVNQLDLIAKCG